jgi:hypothetical protein
MSTTARQFVREATEAYGTRLREAVASRGVPPGDARAAGERAAAVTTAGMDWNDAVGPFLDTRGVQALLGGPSRQAVAERVGRRRLLALRTAGAPGRARRVYPAWQFDGATPKLLPRVLEAVGYDPDELTHGWHVAAWLSTPDKDLDGLRPRDLLAADHPDRVLAGAADVRYELGVDELRAAHGAQRRLT